jgi:SMC interacting uncharacterized protein involved in chromosome segregation
VILINGCLGFSKKIENVSKEIRGLQDRFTLEYAHFLQQDPNAQYDLEEIKVKLVSFSEIFFKDASNSKIRDNELLSKSR